MTLSRSWIRGPGSRCSLASGDIWSSNGPGNLVVGKQDFNREPHLHELHQFTVLVTILKRAGPCQRFARLYAPCGDGRKVGAFALERRRR